MTGRAQTEDGQPPLCEFRDRLILALGVGKTPGRIDTLESKVKTLESMQFRLILMICGSSVAGGGMVGLAFKIFNG